VYSTNPARLCSSSANAADKPEIPPPIMAMRFMARYQCSPSKQITFMLRIAQLFLALLADSLGALCG
jgi:hypothetical protein